MIKAAKRLVTCHWWSQLFLIDLTLGLLLFEETARACLELFSLCRSSVKNADFDCHGEKQIIHLLLSKFKELKSKIYISSWLQQNLDDYGKIITLIINVKNYQQTGTQHEIILQEFQPNN